MFLRATHTVEITFEGGFQIGNGTFFFFFDKPARVLVKPKI
jgi:hypothetical protein